MPSKGAARAEPPANQFEDAASKLPSPVFHDPKHHLKIFQGDCLEILAAIPENSVDLIFADPPYFLSNNGITCHAGKMVSVNKGKWDKSKGADLDHEFNRAWLAACQRVLKPNGSIWVSGTSHVIHSVGFAMQQLGMKLLNDISFQSLSTAHSPHVLPETKSLSILQRHVAFRRQFYNLRFGDI